MTHCSSFHRLCRGQGSAPSLEVLGPLHPPPHSPEQALHCYSAGWGLACYCWGGQKQEEDSQTSKDNSGQRQQITFISLMPETAVNLKLNWTECMQMRIQTHTQILTSLGCRPASTCFLPRQLLIVSGAGTEVEEKQGTHYRQHCKFVNLELRIPCDFSDFSDFKWLFTRKGE